MDADRDDGWQRDDASGEAPSGTPRGPYGYTHDSYAGQQAQHPPAGYGYEAPEQPPAEARTNVFSVVSLVASILGLVGVLAFIGSIVGIVFAILARKEIAADPSQQGKALADWGMILGIVGLVFWLFMGLMMVFMAALFGRGPWWDPWWY